MPQRTDRPWIDSGHLDQLCDAVRHRVELEVARGNRVIQTWNGWPFDAVAMKFASRLSRDELDSTFSYRVQDDPYYWGDELLHQPSKQMLVCSYPPKPLKTVE